MAAASFLTVKARVARALLGLTEYLGEDAGAGRILIRHKITQNDLAAMAGVARENVSIVPERLEAARPGDPLVRLLLPQGPNGTQTIRGLLRPRNKLRRVIRACRLQPPGQISRTPLRQSNSPPNTTGSINRSLQTIAGAPRR